MKKSRRSRFARIVFLVTALTHATFALAAAELMRRVGVPHPALAGAMLALALLYVFVRRMRGLFPDRPRSRLALHLIEEPFFVHWCAALGACVPIVVYALGKAIVLVAQGRAPELPTTFAFAAYLLAFALAMWGVFVRRRWVRTHELDIVIPGLPAAFDGYRVAQLSDLHLGGLTPPAWGDAWARLANAAAPDLVAVTGDLVSSGTDFHQDIARVIGSLRAADGVFVSMGNHDYFGDGEPLVTLLRATGAVVLRNEGRNITRNGATLFVAGVDDTWTRRADLVRTLADRDPAVCTLLLAHDPELFPLAARHGVSLVLSGHTHGGQVALPFFPKLLGLGKLAHRFHLGLYRDGDSSLYVHPGLGTTGPPIRVGVAPEIAILTLRAA
ncbi:MAG TPA: metallophosphoesterase [Polyangiaceae bacterium]|nr:metallophosphoesterase [Polyangiaceae bacterium]